MEPVNTSTNQADQLTDHAPETPNLNPPPSFQKSFTTGFIVLVLIAVIASILIFFAPR